MPTDYSAVAARAMDDVRAKVPFKSLNKLHDATDADFQRDRRELAEDKVLVIRSAKGLDLDQRVALIEQEGAGNCAEMATLAHAFLRRQPNIRGLGMIGILPPGDHQFTVVGMDKTKLNLPISQWGSDCYIIDPWARIACPAANFAFAWKQKMRKWQSNEKFILDGAASMRAQRYVWIDPVSPAWFNQMESAPRMLMEYIP